ncbi:MAG: serine/threonine-protein kinase [Pseudomonadota bacterium]
MRLPGYKIERLIAEGGMAAVYLAVQESLDRYVALKLLKRFDSPTQTLRFFNEGRILASLNHRNIITIHDIGVVDERHYIAMEYLQGGDLKQRISDGMGINAALDLLEILGGCLDFVHRKGIIHRDIKPENILFRGDGTPIITDFGIAKQDNVDTSLTMDGTALGSPHYLSPEQAGCKPLDGRADIYSLGIIFYEMITGHKPYQGDSPIDIIMAHLTSSIPVLPPALHRYQDLLERMIAKDPHDRFECAAAMVEYLRGVRETGPIAAARERVSGLLHGFQKSALARKRNESVSQPTHYGRVPFTARSEGTAVVPLHKLWDTLPTVPKSWAIASAFVFAASTAAVALYGVESGSPRQPAAEQAEFLPDDKKEAISEGPQWVAMHGKIADYLNRADDALKHYRLTTPMQDSAYHYYRRVLDLDPTHPAARKGLEAVAEAYADLATSALDRYEYKKAKIYLNRGLAIQPKNQRLLAVERRTNNIRHAGRRFFGKIKSLFD